MIEVMIGLVLVGVLALSVMSVQDYVGGAERSVRSSLDYVSFTTRLNNITNQTGFCRIALGPGASGTRPQAMTTGAASNIVMYNADDSVMFGAGSQYLSLTIQSLTIQALNATDPPAAGGAFPARITAVVGRPESSATRTFTSLLTVETQAATRVIQNCFKIKFSNNPLLAPNCPAPVAAGSAAAPHCDSPTPIPYGLTVANDGVTLMCMLDYTQCCNHPLTFPRLISGDPRVGTGDVRCVPYYCKDGVGHANNWVHNHCLHHGFTTNHGP